MAQPTTTGGTMADETHNDRRKSDAKKIADLHREIYGNGGKGLKERLTVLETQLAAIRNLHHSINTGVVKIIAGLVVAVLAGLGGLIWVGIRATAGPRAQIQTQTIGQPSNNAVGRDFWTTSEFSDRTGFSVEAIREWCQDNPNCAKPNGRWQIRKGASVEFGG